MDMGEDSCVWWLVTHERVAVRDGPSVSAKLVDGLRLGALIHVERVEKVNEGDGTPCVRWLKLHPQELDFFRSTKGRPSHAHLRSAFGQPLAANDDGASKYTRCIACRWTVYARGRPQIWARSDCTAGTDRH